MIWALCVISLWWLIHAYLFFGIIVVHPKSTHTAESHSYLSASTLEITRVKLLHCIYIQREIVCMYICIYATTHIHTVYFDIKVVHLYILHILQMWFFWKAGGGVRWESHSTFSLTVVSWGKGRRGAIVGSYKSWKDLHSVFGHCFFLFLQLSERSINYIKCFSRLIKYA